MGTRKYNLDDDDDEEGAVELTHMGQSLSQIEKFDRPPSYSDDDDDDKLGNLSSKIPVQFGKVLLYQFYIPECPYIC